MATEVAPGVFFWTRDELGLAPPASAIPTAVKSEYIQHHSGGEQLGRADFGAWWREVQGFHMKSNGWNDIGYNFGIASDTRDPNIVHILEGRGWGCVGAHTVNHNTVGLGVCYLRNGVATDGVKRGARWIYDESSKREKKQLKQLVHADAMPTQCAGSDLNDWVHAGMQAPGNPNPTPLPPVVTGKAIGLAACAGGYWIAASDGGVFAYSLAEFHGSAVGIADSEIVGLAGKQDGTGYWLTGVNGAVYAFGSAGYFGGMHGKQLNAPIVDIEGTTTGQGYRLIAADGGTFCFGDAQFYGAPVR